MLSVMLRNAKDTRCVVWVGLYFVLTWLAWRLDWAVSVVVLCYFSFAGACITHNSMHLRTFKGDTEEVLWRYALSLTTLVCQITFPSFVWSLRASEVTPFHSS